MRQQRCDGGPSRRSVKRRSVYLLALLIGVKIIRDPLGQQRVGRTGSSSTVPQRVCCLRTTVKGATACVVCVTDCLLIRHLLYPLT